MNKFYQSKDGPFADRVGKKANQPYVMENDPVSGGWRVRYLDETYEEWIPPNWATKIWDQSVKNGTYIPYDGEIKS